MKVYLAGSEGHVKLCTYNANQNIFGTFYKEVATTNMINHLNERNHKGLITIDSGAHSFFAFAGESNQASYNARKVGQKMPDHKEYFFRYLKWIKENYHKFSYFVELDLQKLFGIELIKLWRQILKNEGVYGKCITVYHHCDSWDDFIEILDTTESGYIALPGIRNRVMKLPYMKCLKEAYKRGIRVHGFALTKPEITMQYPFFSVDSTSWISGGMHGGTIYIDRFGGLNSKKIDPKNITEVTNKISLSHFNKDKKSYLMKANEAIKMVDQYSEFLERYWIQRGVNWSEQIKKRLDGSLNRSNGDC